MTTKISEKLASVAAVLRTGHKNDDGASPVRIRVTYDRQSRYYAVTYNGQQLYMSDKQWADIHSLDKKGKPIAPRGDNKEMRDTWADVETTARNAVKEITKNGQPFTFDRFEKEFLTQDSKRGFLKIFADYLEEIRTHEENSIGTYKAYKNAFVAFNKFRGAKYKFESRRAVEIQPGKELQPIELSREELKKFESFMKDQGAGKNTIAMYMRALKVVYNHCIYLNPSLREFYPFARKAKEKGKYTIKTGSGKKGEALAVEELQKFISINTTSGLPEHEAKLLWLFSFYCQGMNFRDICLLQYSNIQGDFISYVRQKTKETEVVEEPITVPLTDAIREIIVTLGNSDKLPTSYVFDFVRRDMDPEYRYDVIKQKIKHTNKWLKYLCEANDLPVITTYWARHTYASLMKEAGESVELIRELLGHSDIRTTETYLKRFDINRKREANNKVMSILKTA